MRLTGQFKWICLLSGFWWFSSVSADEGHIYNNATATVSRLSAEPIQIPLASPWVPIQDRTRLRSLSIGYTDHDGNRGSLEDLVDRPMAIVFFYSRCPNTYKCSAAITKFASLQRAMNIVGFERDIRLLAITYEPQFDTPRRIKRFVTSRGLVTNLTTMAIRLNPEQHAAFIEDLKPPVAYNADWVTAHGIELNLLDSKGRFVRKYGTILWDNDDVVRDVKRLLDEE